VAITSGFTVNVHYCMGKISSVKLHASDSDACGKCGKPGSKGGDCCKDVHKFLKVDESHQAAKVFAPHALFAMDLNLPVAVFQAPQPVIATIHAAYHPNAPPLISPRPIFLRNCVFLI
jgi:hypothetical protein